MSAPGDKPAEPEPLGPEGVPVDAPDNTAPAISPHAVSRMHRAEDDAAAWRNSPEYSDKQNLAIDDRVAGERWIPGPGDIDVDEPDGSRSDDPRSEERHDEKAK